MAQLPKPEEGLPEGSGRVGWLAGQFGGMNATETGGQISDHCSVGGNSWHVSAIYFLARRTSSDVARALEWETKWQNFRREVTLPCGHCFGWWVLCSGYGRETVL